MILVEASAFSRIGSRCVALEAINLNCDVVVAGPAEMFWILDRNRLAIRTIHRMTINAAFEAVLLRPDAFMHRIITLMVEQVHVVPAHEVSVLDALIALAFRDLQLDQIEADLPSNRKRRQIKRRDYGNYESPFRHRNDYSPRPILM